MLKLNKEIRPIKFREEIKNIHKFNKSQIDLHELNKQENNPVIFKVNNNLPSGMILIDDLTSFTQGIQRIYRRAINSYIPESKKRVKKYIKDSTGLVISNVRAGSFEIELKQHRTQVIDESSNLDFEKLTGNAHSHSLKSITDILDSLYTKNVKQILLDYDLETFKASKEWIKYLEKSNNDFIYFDSDKEYIFDNQKILETSNIMDTLDEKVQENLEITGILSAVNHQASTINITESETGENYYIKVYDDKFRDAKYKTNNFVTVGVKLDEVIITDEVVSSEMYIDDIKNINILNKHN